MKTIEERAKEHSIGQWDELTAKTSYMQGALEQKAIDEELRLKKCDDMTEAEYKRETAFMDWYLENGKGTPAFSDAIEWARKETIGEACEWLKARNVLTEASLKGFRKAMGGIIMNKNLDLTKILDGCPEGTKFYHSTFGDVRFEEINKESEYPIKVLLSDNYRATVTSEGFHHKGYDGECILFPSKDQRDWSKFKRFWDKTEIKKFDPKTFHPFDKVLGRCGYDNWCIDFFAYKREKCCVCVGGGYYHCIPYNEETKHLLGTNNDCPDYYKWWEE